MKKFLAMLLAVMLVLSLGVTAMAADTAAGSGSITITGAQNGSTYKLHKIFDATYDANGNVRYSTTDATLWNYLAGLETSDDTHVFNTYKMEGDTTMYVSRALNTDNTEKTDVEIINWLRTEMAKADGLKSKLGTGTEATAADGKAVFTNVADGYYYVASPVTGGTAIMIQNVGDSKDDGKSTRNVTVEEKNTDPNYGGDDSDGKKIVTAEGTDAESNPTNVNTVATTDKTQSYTVGETVTYQLKFSEAKNHYLTTAAGETVDETSNTNHKVYKYTVKDEYPDVMSLQGDPVVTVSYTAADGTTEVKQFVTKTATYDQTKKDNYSLTEGTGTGTKTFTIEFPWAATVDTDKNDFYYLEPATIIVTYKLKLDNAPTSGNELKNEASITPNGHKSTGGDQTQDETVVTGSIKLEKYIAGGTELLPGAEFVVKQDQRADGAAEAVWKYLKWNADGKKYEWVESAANATHYTTTKTADLGGAQNNTGKATADTVTDDGKIFVYGLKAGTYVFEEVKAPTGYNMPDNPDTEGLTITVKANGESTETDLNPAAAKVYNSKAVALPSTGGIGTTIFYVVGSVLVAVALVLLITKKRMGSEA